MVSDIRRNLICLFHQVGRSPWQLSSWAEEVAAEVHDSGLLVRSAQIKGVQENY